MATSLLLACGLNEQIIEPFIHVSEESGVDGTFIISSILGQRLRIQNSGIILICLQQTYQHYYNAGLRLGYNLNMSKGKNLRIIEPISDIANDFIKSCWTTSTTTASADSTKNSLCEILLNLIENEIKEYLHSKNSITIIIDNLSILLNLGSTKNSILKFCYNLRQLTKATTSTPSYQQTIITKLNNCEIYEILNNNLKSISDVQMNVIKLKSGNFKEVDGRLEIIREKINESCSYEMKKIEKNILYKINDKNIKIYNPGEVGIKL